MYGQLVAGSVPNRPLKISSVHPEGPRYTAPMLFLSGPWVGPEIWTSAAGFLGHRGWRGEIVDLRALDGGIAARAAVVADHVRTLEGPPVLVAIDAAAAVALAVARSVDVRATVLLSPLMPGAPVTHELTWSWKLVWALVRGGILGPPAGRIAEALFVELPDGIRANLAGEAARMLGDLGRRSEGTRTRSPCPTLIVRGEGDPVVSRDDVRTLAAVLGAAVEEFAGGRHWLVIGPSWRACVQIVHRWLVRTLGESLLELHAEAMAERGDDSDET